MFIFLKYEERCNEFCTFALYNPAETVSNGNDVTICLRWIVMSNGHKKIGGSDANYFKVTVTKYM